MTELAFPKPKRLKLTGDDYRQFAQDLLRRDGYKCRCCGSMRNLTIHHIQKRSQLGSDVPGNCLTLCVSCHDRVEHKGNEKEWLDIEVLDVFALFVERGNLQSIAEKGEP